MPGEIFSPGIIVFVSQCFSYRNSIVVQGKLIRNFEQDTAVCRAIALGFGRRKEGVIPTGIFELREKMKWRNLAVNRQVAVVGRFLHCVQLVPRFTPVGMTPVIWKIVLNAIALQLSDGSNAFALHRGRLSGN